MTLHAFPPTSIRPHDSKLLEHSGLLARLRLAQLQKPWYVEQDVTFQVHGDPAYRFMEHPCLSSGGIGDVRISEEFGYAGLKGEFSYLDYKAFLKLKKSPITQIIFVALIIRNAFVCLNGSQVSDFFNCAPPSLVNYTAQGPAMQNNLLNHVPDHAYAWVWEGEEDEDLLLDEAGEGSEGENDD
jgi:hypothetical protein